MTTENPDTGTELAEVVRLPTSDVWAQLAQQCRTVADLAREVVEILAPSENPEATRLAEKSLELAAYVDQARAEMAATTPPDTDTLARLRAVHEALTVESGNIRSLVADCRYDTYRVLKERGMPVEEIAEGFGHSTTNAVYNVLRRRGEGTPR